MAEANARGRGMVEDERYCIDVLSQISAVQAALDSGADGQALSLKDLGSRRPVYPVS